MTKLIWGASGQRVFEAGVDRGVLYVPGLAGVPWNGLKAVKESSTGGEPQPYYIDGFKYANVASAEEFQATLEAFSSPDEFLVCDGSGQIAAGLSATQQPRKSFGLSYRTLVGNDLTGLDSGYKIHLVYNALAAPSGRNNSSMTQTLDALELSWEISTRPPAAAFGYKPTAHLVIDSRKTDPDLLVVIEGYLYGANGLLPALPTPAQIISQFTTWKPLTLARPLNFIGMKSNTVSTITNLATNPSFESVVPGTTIVRTNLCLNPSLTNSFDGWVAYTIAPNVVVVRTHIATAGYAGDGLVRLTFTTGGTATGNYGDGTGMVGYFDVTVPILNTVTGSVYIRPSFSATIALYREGSGIGTPVLCPSGVWTRLSQTGVGQSGRYRLQLADGTIIPTDGTIDADAVLVEQTDQLRPYFDGSTVDALGFDYSWTGVADTSTSTAKASVVEVRRNICNNPNFETDVAGWAGETNKSTIARDTLKMFAGAASLAVTLTSTAMGGTVYAIGGLTVGTTYTASVMVYNATTNAAPVTTSIVNIGFGTEVTARDSWTRSSITFTATLTSHILNVGVTAAPISGNVFYVDSALIEVATTLGSYFDGNTPNDGDFINVWSGTANASASLQSGISLSGVSGSNSGPVIQSTNWAISKNRSLRIVPVLINSHAYITLTTVVGATYTVLATCRLLLAQTGSQDIRARTIMSRSGGTDTNSIQAPNEVGTTPLSHTFVAYGSSTNIFLFNGASQGNGDVWWDNVVIVEGEYTGPYFDGSSPALYNKQLVQPAWSGTEHASTSVLSYLTELPVASSDGDAHVVTNNLWVLINDQWYNNGELPLAVA